MTSRGRIHPGHAVIAVAAGVWWLSAAWLWQLAAAHEALLPLVPRIAWMAPGLLWSRTPVLAVVAAGFLAAATAWLLPRTGGRLRLVRLGAFLLFGLLVGVTVLWGTALFAATFG